MNPDDSKNLLVGNPRNSSENNASGRTSTPPPIPHNARTSRIPPPLAPNNSRTSTPPPIPSHARTSRVPPPSVSNNSRTITSPPIPPITSGKALGEPSNPGTLPVEPEKEKLLGLLKEFYPEEAHRLKQNGNGYPALQAHLARMRDGIMIDLEQGNRFFFVIPIKWVVLAAAAIALGAGGLAFHSCTEAKEAQQQIEIQKKEIQDLKKQIQQKETAKPSAEKAKPATSYYIPKALRTPPHAPNRAPQRIARNSLRT